MGTQPQADEDNDEHSDPPSTLETARLTRKAGKVWKVAGASMMTAAIVPMKEASSGGDGAEVVDDPTGG
jgi:hypothetical protein